MPATQLTQHFTLEEFIASQEAARRGIDNTPTPEIVGELRKTAELLEQVRTLVGDKPIVLSSGYRCPTLNAAIGGASNSQHVTGQAADFNVIGMQPLDVCRMIAASSLKWGQTIAEYCTGGGGWVHISTGTKCELLTINNNGTQWGIHG